MDERSLDELAEMALRLGQETAFSAEEAARGMQELFDAGIALEDDWT